MSISRVGVQTAAATSLTMPTPAVGDLCIICAYRLGSATAPTLPAGWQSILTQANGATGSFRIGFKIATSTSTASGTWTNATLLTCHVYRSGSYATGGSLYIGGHASTSQATNTINYPALTMTHGDNTSWALGFAAANNTTNTVDNPPPSGMTNESALTGATARIAGHDTNGTVSSWGSTNATSTGTPGSSVSATVELIENQPGTAISNIIQWVHTSYNAIISTAAGNNYAVPFPQATLSGNGLVCAVMYPSGATPAITDDKSNTWPVSGAAGTVTADSGGMVIQIFRLTSATAGTRVVTVGFGSTVQQPVAVWLGELFGITGTVNGSTTTVLNTPVNSGGIVAPPAFTPTNNNANGGNLILSFMANGATSGGTNPALIVPETGYSLNDADVAWTQGQGNPNASQFRVQATSAATTPQFYLNAGGTDTYIVAAIALSLGTQGTAKPAGIHVDRRIYFANASGPTAWLLQIPSTGNLGVLRSFLPSTGTPSWTAASDSDGTSWTSINPVVGAPRMWYNPNQTAKPNRTVTCTINAAAQILQCVYDDISGAATSPLDTSAGVGSTSVNNSATFSTVAIITPAQQNELILSFLQIGLGPSTTVSSPAGAFADLPIYQTATGTGSITTTSLTISATTWGAFSSANTPLIFGPNITVGTAIQSGAGPFVVNPSQSAASAAVTQAQTDSDTISFGNFAGSYYNGSSTAAQTWTINIANQPSNSVTFVVAAFKAAPGAGGLPQGLNYDTSLPAPLPPGSIQLRTWTWRQVDRIGQDNLVNRRSMQSFDSPPAPIPQIDRTWTWNYNLNLIGQDVLPHRQQDWKNPIPPPRVDAYWARGFDWIRLTPRPTTYFDRPIYPPSIDPTWLWSQTRMIGQDTLPFRQQDWPNPAPIPQTDRNWTQGFSITLSTVTVVFPFNQFDWPNPVGPPRIDQFLGWSQTRMQGQDVLPFRQQDWPLPPPIPSIDHAWTQGFSLLLEVFVLPPMPHNQFDWPNPTAPPSIDHFWSQPLPLPLIPPPAPGTTVQLITTLGLFFNPNASAIP